MKTCPYCHNQLGFFTYVFRYGSDTLTRHPAKAHKNEHECLKCKKKIWIYHNPFRYKNLITQFQLGGVLAAWAAAILWVRPAFGLSMQNTVLAAIMFLFFTVPFAIVLANYASASFKEEPVQ